MLHCAQYLTFFCISFCRSSVSSNFNLDLSAEQDSEFYLPDFSISSPVNQDYSPDHYVPYSPIRIEEIEENPNSKTQHTASPTKTIKKDKRGRRGSKSKNNLKVHQFNEKSKKDKKFKAVHNAPQLFFISSITDLPYSCEHCLVGTKLPNVFNCHLGSDKHISTISRNKTSANCIFCCKNFTTVHNFKNHLKGATHFKKFSNFSN